MSENSWRDSREDLTDRFADGAYATVKGQVRTFVMHQHLLEQLPPPPATVLDVGGGAGHQSFPLARAGYQVTLLDPSETMLDKAGERLQPMRVDARKRVEFVRADGLRAHDAVQGRTFDAVLSHGVLGYLDEPGPMLEQLCACASSGGVVSIMTANAKAMAVRPALEQRWDDALAAFDERHEVGVLGVTGRADTVDELSGLLRHYDVEPVRWYGVWLFVDWLGFGGVELDPDDERRVKRICEVELEASRRDPYRALSRVFHLVGRKA